MEGDPPTPEDLPPRQPRSDVAPQSRYQDPLAVVRDVSFTQVFRGYAREEVDAFVAEVSELIAELDATRSPESAVRAALDRVGEETSGILQRARETADDVAARSRAQADDRLREAERDARVVRADAEARVEELDADIELLWRERGRLIEEVRRLADEAGGVANAAVERMPPPSTADEAPDVGAARSEGAGDLPAASTRPAGLGEVEPLDDLEAEETGELERPEGPEETDTGELVAADDDESPDYIATDPPDRTRGPAEEETAVDEVVDEPPDGTAIDREDRPGGDPPP